MSIRIQNQDCTQPIRQGVPRLLLFVLHESRAVKTVLAACYEKDAEKYGEEDALMKQARCQKLRIWRTERKYHAFSVNDHTTNIFSPCTRRNGNPNQNPYSWRGRSELTCSVPCWHTTIRCLVPPPQVVEHFNTTKLSFFYRHCLQLF